METNEIIQKLNVIVEEKKDQILSDLITFIQYNTENPPGNEKHLANFIAHKMHRIGAHVEFEEVFKERPNVLCSLKFSDNGPSFLWNSHMDTVPVGNIPWNFDPLEGKKDSNFIYGRGASDAKGSLAAMMAAVEILKELDLPLRGELLFTPVVSEERGGEGTDYFVKKGMAGRAPIAAVVGEPTKCQIALGNRGSNRRKIIVKGVATHSSNPDKGKNAIYRASKLTLAIEELHESLKNKEKNPYLGSPVVSVNMIKGGVEHNVVPDQAEIVVDRRRIPGEGENQLDEEIEQIVERIRQTDPTFEYEIVNLNMDKNPAMTNDSHFIVEKSANTIYELTGRKASLTGIKAGTDMTNLKNDGNVPSIIYGPGDMGVAHTVDEFVPINEVLEAVKFYVLLATKVLK
ncbi:acetylornithine deacetylase/succinyl-diaminopimelate desuccinylase [Lentibacillus persicus]|uniref:Acetylornithine deacetylase/succinyl-diaminopimelate desuccinylase n=1 Tax=Lentibacillus persicus TaxID=640948 RepID=A0A1I1VWP3_9BACI|nr:M20 family metallopeptidase [Lentibacillus persicus]SFD87265.1 acetylornithine deacetylase/succinyl-diaminopimelate desuccinylase [Lentibacillus persicus]